MTFIEYGGSWKFRKITETVNTTILDINETELQYQGIPINRRLPTGPMPAGGYTLYDLPTNCFYEFSLSGYCSSQARAYILCNQSTANNIWAN